jgi:hypothetical protein
MVALSALPMNIAQQLKEASTFLAIYKLTLIHYTPRL